MSSRTSPVKGPHWSGLSPGRLLPLNQLKSAKANGSAFFGGSSEVADSTCEVRPCGPGSVTGAEAATGTLPGAVEATVAGADSGEGGAAGGLGLDFSSSES